MENVLSFLAALVIIWLMGGVFLPFVFELNGLDKNGCKRQVNIERSE